MDPPQCVQNAMMKQDKKPFTYTPGGIDLSEIKSPRMARRIERNANYTGAPEGPRPVPQQPVGPLPPSALAAMQPQMHVQVFPSGPPPPPPAPKFGPPPPPPPPANIPRPPPPPTEPLPTQKVVTSENQVLERPDMTKIIPDNPMALLRKTGGPQPKSSFMDEIYSNKSVQTPPVQAQQQRSPPIQQNQRWPQQEIRQQSPPGQPVQQNQRWSQVPPPAPVQQTPPASQWSPPTPQWSPPVQQYQPKIIERNHQQSPPVQPEPQRYHPKVIERNPSIEEPVKTSTAHLGSLYIPPINQQQRGGVTSPPPPPRDPQSPQIQSPGTPTLKEAPKPWQKQQKQTEELPPWAKKEPAPQQWESPQIQSPQFQQQPQRFPQDRPPVQQQAAHPNAVFVTQPLVFQHPGPQPNRQQQPRVDAQGAIVIPVQVERKLPAKPATPGTPGNERSLNRQQSWSNNPPQSNAFKKITQTDGDDDDENAPVTEHGPRYPQQFQQTPPVEQMRKLKLSEGDRELMNRFRQGVDDDTSLHNEVDPRYRGPAIPSKAFKLLQSMTDGSTDSSSTGATVSRGPAPSGNRTPQVRTIPIQIERDDQPRNYVHPSEQTVPEPKKYTGSSIPSRSFKILQAMTAPDSCANANEVNENYDPSSYNQWGYDPNYPPPVPPYWPDYYYNNYYYQNSKENENADRDIRQTPVPYWGYYPPPSPYPYMQPPLRTPGIESDSETARNTPLPWGYYPPYYAPTPTREMEEWGNHPQDNKEENYAPPQYQYPPYWDPYYYYYGYPPPVYSPYPFYEQSENEEVAGYSSTDEMAYFSKKIKIGRDEPVREPSKTPQILITPTLPQELNQKPAETESERDTSDSDSETEVETEEECLPARSQSGNALQAIRSVKDIRVYDNDEEENPDEDDCSEETEDNDDSYVSYIVEDEETIPHQLSVIFEESEKSTESKRESSVLSDSTTIAEKSDAEDDEDNDENSTAVSVKLPLKIKVEVNDNEEITTVIVGESEIKIEEGDDDDDDDDEDEPGDTYAAFTIKTPVLEKTEPETEAVICTSDDKNIPKVDENDGDEEDWWGILNKDDDIMPAKPKKVEPVASSASSSNSSSSESSKKEAIDDDHEDSSSESESEEESESDDSDSEKNNDEAEPEPLSIKERIRALQDSINNKREKLKEENEMKMSVKDKVSAIEAGNLHGHSKTTSTKSSVKSFEEFSEEEGDSGVTSDMSRHISDNEEFPELKKMTRYQRAATHSRLFKLLQEVCELEEDDEDEEKKEDEVEDKSSSNLIKDEAPRRDQLSLPLKNVSDESFSSSGITSPGSPINDKLVTELIQSILKRKKGQVFRNIPKEKLQAAAKRILQEEFLDDLSTPDSSYLSPLRNSTESSSPAQTPQEFYNDYMQYYDSWSDAERLYNENYDILPSKAFRLLQEHSGLNKTGAIAGLLAKCPKVLSSKNVHQELLKLMEESCESPSTDKSLESSEVTSAS